MYNNSQLTSWSIVTLRFFTLRFHRWNLCTIFFTCTLAKRTQRYFVEAELGSLPNSMFESYTAQVLIHQSCHTDFCLLACHSFTLFWFIVKSWTNCLLQSKRINMYNMNKMCENREKYLSCWNSWMWVIFYVCLFIFI